MSREWMIPLMLAGAVAMSPAFASQSCRFQAPRTLQVDLAGVQSVRVASGPHTLHLRGTSGADLGVTGRACASDEAALAGLTVTQRREGNQLVVDIGGQQAVRVLRLFGGSYAYLDVTVQLPANLPVTLAVGSGDAVVSDLHELRAQVGSGNLQVARAAGEVTVSVGSGDIDLNTIGKLAIGAVGSGEAKAAGVRGDVRVGSIGSGTVQLRQVSGAVHVGSLGSGDLRVDGVGGDFTLDVVGSGDLTHAGVKGKVNVPRDDN